MKEIGLMVNVKEKGNINFKMVQSILEISQMENIMDMGQ